MADNKRGRYLVFKIYQYYPGGGLSDIDFDTDDKEAAIEKAQSCSGDEVYVWDRIEDEIIYDKG